MWPQVLTYPPAFALGWVCAGNVRQWVERSFCCLFCFCCCPVVFAFRVVFLKCFLLLLLSCFGSCFPFAFCLQGGCCELQTVIVRFIEINARVKRQSEVQRPRITKHFFLEECRICQWWSHQFEHYDLESSIHALVKLSVIVSKTVGHVLFVEYY